MSQRITLIGAYERLAIDKHGHCKLIFEISEVARLEAAKVVELKEKPLAIQVTILPD